MGRLIVAVLGGAILGGAFVGLTISHFIEETMDDIVDDLGSEDYEVVDAEVADDVGVTEG